jgi:hypothetical protein
MESVELWSVNNRILMSKHHFLAIVKRIYHDRPGVAEFDLEHGVAILTPPTFTDACMIFP